MCDQARSEICADIDMVDFMRCVGKAVNEIFQRRCWKHAFEHNGICGDQAKVAISVLQQLGLDVVGELPRPRAPSLADLKTCCPSRSRRAEHVHEIFFSASALRATRGASGVEARAFVNSCATAALY